MISLMGAGGGGGGPPTDPDFASVVALLHMDGSDASTTFTDVIGKAYTPAGNAQLDTAQFQFGTASGLFDGTGDQLNTASHADFGYGTGNYTIEWWFRSNGVLAVTTVMLDQRVSEPQIAPVIYVETNGRINMYLNGAARISSAIGVISANTWHHIALSRVSGTTRLFVGGTQRGSNYTDANNYIASPIRMGDGFGAGGNGVNGWLDDLRITKGVGRYTTTFTPPTAPFPDS
jgi:hypothetical protein